MEHISFIVSGTVQGVGFRYFTRNAALKLGLFGWARNLPTGQVEVEAEGPKDMLEKLLKACHEGPPQSKVTSVTVRSRTPIEAPVFESFEIR